MKPSWTRRFWLVVVIVCGAAFAWWVVHPVAPVRRYRPRIAAAPHQPPKAQTTPAPPATRTASPVTQATSGPELALIIDDCGQWLSTERGFIALPIPLTLSVLPDVRYTRLIADEAAAAGKGVMLHLPMETISGLNPGPGKVTTEMTDSQIVSQVDDDLAQVPLAQGVNNHEGSRATQDTRVMRDVAETLARHGKLFFVDSMTIGDSVAGREARAAGLPTGSRDVFIDNRADVAATERQLLDAAAIARRNGSAIAIGHPRPTTLVAVRLLAPQLETEGVRFVLVSQILEAPPQPR